MSHKTVNCDQSIIDFARRFLTGRIAWHLVPRQNSIVNYGSVAGLCIYRQAPFQVELFIVPGAPSSFTVHRHPHVDAVEFPLAGHSWLNVNGEPMWNNEQIEQWLLGNLPSRPVPIGHDDWHEGGGSTPYAFLSIQKWSPDVEMTSVGIDWEGESFSLEQTMMWQSYMTVPSVEHQVLA